MLLIVEGPDGTGKSTLCSELSDRLGCRLFKPVGSPLDGMTTVESQGHDRGAIGALIEVADRVDLVMDRSFPSELVYSSMFGRDFDEQAAWDLDRRVSEASHLGILVTFADQTGFAVAHARGVDDLTASQWTESWHRYDRYVERSAMTWLRIDGEDPVPRMVERVMKRLVAVRGTSDSEYMGMAREASKRSTCLARRQGAVLVSATGHVIAIGYNGAPSRFPHPEKCERLRRGMESSEGLSCCNDSHAEENCIVHAALNGADPSGGTLFTLNSPCHRCARMLINAGIVRIVFEREYDPRALKMLEQAHIDLEVL